MSNFFRNTNFYFYDTGERTEEKPQRFTLSDPIIYYSETGRKLIPEEERKDTGTQLKNIIVIELDEVKKFMKVEHDLDDDEIQELLYGAIDDVSQELNRGWVSELDIPASIRTAIKQTTLSRYENRGEFTIPDSARDIIKRYRLSPGL